MWCATETPGPRRWRVVEAAPWWSVLIAPALLLFAAVMAVAADAVLSASEAVGAPRPSALLHPVRDAGRLLAVQP